MGFFRRLFGLSGPVDDLLRSIERNVTSATLPHDEELWRQAESRVGNLSRKAVSDEYERLVQKKYRRR